MLQYVLVKIKKVSWTKHQKYQNRQCTSMLDEVIFIRITFC